MATKIIKQGKKPGVFRFRCPHCGCIWETDIVKARYIWSTPDYFADCPTCHRLCCAHGDKQ